ncbi:MAG: thiamine pyrophosphate-dependent enzyme [Phycisphaerales bacterium]
MQLIREFELRCMQQYQQADPAASATSTSAKEASAVGTIACVNKDDPIVLAYRDHGHALARGMSTHALHGRDVRQKRPDASKGKGGSMHMFDKPNWLFGGHGIVGAQTPLGAGFAFAARYEWEVLGTGPKKVCLCYLGDGALNQGAFHEAQNLAGLLNLPVIFIVENNGYSMGTSIERGTTMAHDLCLKAAGYGIKAVEIQGMNILDIYDAFKPLADECRDLQRPAFVDLKTYRYQGHSMSDPQKYRTKEEVETFKERDSIASLASHLMTSKAEGGRACLSEDDWKKMQEELAEIVRDAVEFAESAEVPDVEAELESDVYINIEPNLSPTAKYGRGETNPLL